MLTKTIPMVVNSRIFLDKLSTAQARSQSSSDAKGLPYLRLSSMFDGWTGTEGSSQSLSKAERNVRVRPSIGTPSRPVSIAFTQDFTAEPTSIGMEPADGLDHSFENLMNDLGIKDTHRSAMLNLPLERKKFLLEQNGRVKAAQHSTPPSLSKSSSAIRPVDAGFVASLSRSSSALAESLANRLSMASITSWTSQHSEEGSDDSNEQDNDQGELDRFANRVDNRSSTSCARRDSGFSAPSQIRL